MIVSSRRSDVRLQILRTSKVWLRTRILQNSANNYPSTKPRKHLILQG